MARLLNGREAPKEDFHSNRSISAKFEPIMIVSVLSKPHDSVHVHTLNKGYFNNNRGYIWNYIIPIVDAIKEQISISGATNVKFY